MKNRRGQELLQEGVFFWVWGAGAARGWVGFGRVGRFSNRGYSIRMRLGTVHFVKKERGKLLNLVYFSTPGNDKGKDVGKKILTPSLHKQQNIFSGK